MTSSKISHNIIKALYDTLHWYNKNKGAGKAGTILKYFEMWKDLHVFSINISKEGWNKIAELAGNLGLNLRDNNEKWLFLFSIETYLHTLIRAIALSKIGRISKDWRSAYKAMVSMKNIFSPSLFEWVFIALSDQSLDKTVRSRLEDRINTIFTVIYNLDLTALIVDAFRDIYQNILPAEIRKSLGEFYTKEEIVDEVLDAIGLNETTIQRLYNEWKTAKESGKMSPIVLDPACGSGTFIVRIIRRVFKYLGCKPDIAQFLEDVIVGIDINPFAVEMAKLNYILAISDEMSHRCKMSYTPTNIRIYWADSLAIFRKNMKTSGHLVVHLTIPSLSEIFGSDKPLSFPYPSQDFPVSIEKLIDLTWEAIERNEDFYDLLEYLKEEVGEESITEYERELLEFYNALKQIHQSGNSRLIELLKNSIIVADLYEKCDFVVGNPPWVRIHGIAKHIIDSLRKHYSFFNENSAYDPKFKKAKTPFKEQHDYSLAFIERGLSFLKEGGILGYVITSKILRTTYAGKMREYLILNCTILELRDYSLYPIPLFQDAVNYPLIIAVKKKKPSDNHEVKIFVANTQGDHKTFRVMQKDLPLYLNNLKSPWVIAPHAVIKTLRKVKQNSFRLGDIYEINMGVKTSANNLYIIKEIRNCIKNVADVRLEGGKVAQIEIDLIHALVRGKNIDPFEFQINDYIIFTHNTSIFEPLWDQHQKDILNTLGLLRDKIGKSKVKVKESGADIVYELPKSEIKNLLNSLDILKSKGYNVQEIKPCAVKYCYSILLNKNTILKINIDVNQKTCLVYVSGLKIPNAPKATTHFLSNLNKLLKRDDYKPSLPPWAIFRTSPDKFKDYRIAWQEISKHFEACILPIRQKIKVCDYEKEAIVVPTQKVYFITEPEKSKAVKLVLYLNSDIARSLVKLWAWSARGGHYEHITSNVGHLPIPKSLLECTLWRWVKIPRDQKDINEFIKSIYRKKHEKLTKELLDTFNLTEDEYKELVGYCKWLNELGEEKELTIEEQEEQINEEEAEEKL